MEGQKGTQAGSQTEAGGSRRGGGREGGNEGRGRDGDRGSQEASMAQAVCRGCPEMADKVAVPVSGVRTHVGSARGRRRPETVLGREEGPRRPDGAPGSRQGSQEPQPGPSPRPCPGLSRGGSGVSSEGSDLPRRDPTGRARGGREEAALCGSREPCGDRAVCVLTVDGVPEFTRVVKLHGTHRRTHTHTHTCTHRAHRPARSDGSQRMLLSLSTCWL